MGSYIAECNLMRIELIRWANAPSRKRNRGVSFPFIDYQVREIVNLTIEKVVVGSP